MQYDKVLGELQSLSDPAAVAGMARFGINPANCYGISMVKLRKLAKQIGKNHALAAQLWSSGIHEGRILACLIDEPKEVSEAQLEAWVKGFDSWDVCDQCCGNLFDKTQWASQKAIEWSEREEEFVKRAGFVMMTQIAIHDKKAPDSHFEPFFPIIKREATDPRNFVKKGVNWALRQIGKRNRALNQKAIEVAQEIAQIDSKAARWIAKDALRELTSDKIQQRLRKRL
jgi:3-methyladenine DNA glycosylase AlkD